VPETGALFGVPVHRPQQRIDVDHRPGRDTGQQPGVLDEADQMRPQHRGQLLGVAVGEHARNAKLVFRATVVIDAHGSGIHHLPGPQPTLGRAVRNSKRDA
jgi:hypothetical protein